MENELAGFLAFAVATVGSIYAAVKKEVTAALIAGGVALLALAEAVKSL